MICMYIYIYTMIILCTLYYMLHTICYILYAIYYMYCSAGHSREQRRLTPEAVAGAPTEPTVLCSTRVHQTCDFHEHATSAPARQTCTDLILRDILKFPSGLRRHRSSTFTEVARLVPPESIISIWYCSAFSMFRSVGRELVS